MSQSDAMRQGTMITTAISSRIAYDTARRLSPTTAKENIQSSSLSREERFGTFAAYSFAVASEYWVEAGLLFILPDIAGGLGISLDEAAWIFTSHAAAYSAGMCLSHRMANYFGNRRYILFASFVATLITICSAFSTSLAMCICFRIFAAFAGGTFLPRQMVFISHRFAVQERVGANRDFAVFFILIGRVVGPFLIGWYVDSFNWRWMFLGVVPFQLMGAFLFWRYAVDRWDEHNQENVPDPIGIGLLLLAVASLQVLFDRGQVDGWFESNRVIVLAIFTVLLHLAFFTWQIHPRNKQPLFDVLHVRNRGMLATVAMAVFFGVNLSGSLYILPQYLREVETLTHSAFQTGEILGFAGLVMLLSLAFTGFVVKLLIRFGGRIVIFGCIVLQIAGMLLFVPVITSGTPDRNLLLPLALSSAYMGFMTPALTVAGLMGMDIALVSNARTIYYAARSVGASLGVTLVVLIIDRRMTLHSQRLLEGAFEHVRAGFLPRITSMLPQQTLQNAAEQVAREAMVLSIADVFLVMGFISLLSLLLIPLFPPKPARH
jgi:EmrB/QacA subfamily drug resistance transporter